MNADEAYWKLVGEIDREWPDGEAVGRLRELVEERPAVTRRHHSLALVAIQDAMRHLIAGDQSKLGGIREDLMLTREQLLDEGDSAVEALLVDQVVVCYFRWFLLEGRLTRAMKDGERARVKFYEERVSAGLRRYERALETLARVRKLVRSTPGVQINIAQQQVVRNEK